MDVLPVHSDSSCPSSEVIQAEVRELTTPAQRQGVPADARVVVSDRGASVSIRITRSGHTTQRVYRDEARDCERRAHFVSVLVVVTLMPPVLPDSEQGVASPEPEPEALPVPRGAGQPAPPRASPASSPPPSARPRHVRLELGARGEVSTPIADSVRVASGAATLGVALGAGRVRLLLATGYAPPTELRLTGPAPGRARLQKLDFALGVRSMVTRVPLVFAVDASLLMTRSAVDGRSSHRPRGDTAFDVGGRLGAHLSWSDADVVSPFVTGYASVFPAAPSLNALPQGEVGHLPYLWLGLNFGLALGL